MTVEDVEYKPFTEYQDRKGVEFNIEKLAVGETSIQSYLVKVNKGAKGTKISNELTTKYGNVTKTMFLKQLYTFFWSLLFVFPGIIKSYEYRMIPYLLAENP